MQKHVNEFKRDGYTVFEGLFDRETTEQWKDRFRRSGNATTRNRTQPRTGIGQSNRAG